MNKGTGKSGEAVMWESWGGALFKSDQVKFSEYWRNAEWRVAEMREHNFEKELVRAIQSV
jgi:hypothetical protein